ncbi:hypothetical protein DLAC_01009 [Tieghemostelium lacteum]|uniref:Uncharacterized protein n=1 Tax=Tieghemostelium lacteum TaxID=361077 RepID=A0A152A7I7_TIELA|nr:hypothetical protein DLAC_01009 [Tieghemostelium lacteum]|eukprot:KYR02192.1 hypothetical protein DLAC_01009 [Tieghemostelium lacteum]
MKVYVLLFLFLILNLKLIEGQQCPKATDINKKVKYWVRISESGPVKASNLRYVDSESTVTEYFDVKKSTTKKLMEDIEKLYSPSHQIFKFTDEAASNTKGNYYNSHQRLYLFLEKDNNNNQGGFSKGFVITHSFPELMKGDFEPDSSHRKSQHMICLSLNSPGEIDEYIEILNAAKPRLWKFTMKLEGYETEMGGAECTFPYLSSSKGKNKLDATRQTILDILDDNLIRGDNDPCVLTRKFGDYEFFAFRPKIHDIRYNADGIDVLTNGEFYGYNDDDKTGKALKDTNLKEDNMITISETGVDNFLWVQMFYKVPMYTSHHNGGDNFPSHYIDDKNFLINVVWEIDGTIRPAIHEKVAFFNDSQHLKVCFGDANRQHMHISHSGTIVCFTSPLVYNMLMERKPYVLLNNMLTFGKQITDNAILLNGIFDDRRNKKTHKIEDINNSPMAIANFYDITQGVVTKTNRFRSFIHPINNLDHEKFHSDKEKQKPIVYQNKKTLAKLQNAKKENQNLVDVADNNNNNNVQLAAIHVPVPDPIPIAPPLPAFFPPFPVANPPQVYDPPPPAPPLPPSQNPFEKSQTGNYKQNQLKLKNQKKENPDALDKVQDKANEIPEAASMSCKEKYEDDQDKFDKLRAKVKKSHSSKFNTATIGELFGIPDCDNCHGSLSLKNYSPPLAYGVCTRADIGCKKSTSMVVFYFIENYLISTAFLYDKSFNAAEAGRNLHCKIHKEYKKHFREFLED